MNATVEDDDDNNGPLATIGSEQIRKPYFTVETYLDPADAMTVGLAMIAWAKSQGVEEST